MKTMEPIDLSRLHELPAYESDDDADLAAPRRSKQRKQRAAAEKAAYTNGMIKQHNALRQGFRNVDAAVRTKYQKDPPHMSENAKELQSQLMAALLEGYEVLGQQIETAQGRSNIVRKRNEDTLAKQKHALQKARKLYVAFSKSIKPTRKRSAKTTPKESVKKLRKEANDIKKRHCPPVSKMKRAELLAYIDKHGEHQRL